MYPWQKPWQTVWRAFMAQWSTDTLEDLADALQFDADAIIQHVTVWPVVIPGTNDDWPVEGCCPVAWCCRQEKGLTTLAEVEAAFANACYQADHDLGETAGTRWFINWLDDTDRKEAWTQLLAEVRSEIARRAVAEPVGVGGTVWDVSVN